MLSMPGITCCISCAGMWRQIDIAGELVAGGSEVVSDLSRPYARRGELLRRPASLLDGSGATGAD